MSRKCLLSTCWIGIVLWGVAAAAETPVAVSPGQVHRVTTVRDGCPTFNWSAVEDALAYEVVVYRLSEGPDVGLGPAEPILRQNLPGGALGWTPPLELCLTAGGRYAWSVRAQGEEGTTAWSEPRLFAVASDTRSLELEQALAVLGEYLAEGGSLEELRLDVVASPGKAAPTATADEPSRAARAAARRERRERRARSGSDASSPESSEAVPVPDVVAVRGEVPDSTGVTFGLHGLSASTDDGAAGVVGQSTATSGATVGVLGASASPDGSALAGDNTAGGADLTLFGPGDPEADAVFTEAGIDLASPSVETFEIENSGGGGLALLIDGVQAVTTATDQDTLGALSCAEGQVAKRISGVWICADDIDTNSGGDITAVNAGTGLTGGGVVGDVTVAADFTQTQARVVGSCAPGLAIVAINADGSVVCGLTGGITLISTVDDPANQVGAFTSIARGADGLPVISYYDHTAGALKVAKCNDAACAGGDETITTVDDPPSNTVGWYTSIALGADGLPVISYYDQTAGVLKVAKCNDAACAGGDETITTVDNSANDVGQNTSIALGADGLPVISYRDQTAKTLKVAKCNDAACTGGDETITIVDDPANSLEQHTSIAVGADGLPVISYWDQTAFALKVAKCNDPACTGGDETITTVDDPPTNGVGPDTSIAVGADGLPVISYIDWTAQDLKVAKCNDAACAGGDETITTVDDHANSVGGYNSIAVGADGLPVISYRDETTHALKVAKCNDAACAGGDETLTTVDDPVNLVGDHTSIALGADGLPVISYYDGSVFALKVAKCANASCS